MSKQKMKVEHLHTRYAVVQKGDDVKVYDRVKGAYLRPPAFQTLFSNTKVPIGEREVGLGTFWLNHPARPTFLNGVDMRPGTKQSDMPTGVLNTWQGWGCEPAEGDWSLFKTHLHEVICSGNQEHYDWLIRWIAWGIQNPDKIPKSAVVLKGVPGSGKGIVANVLYAIYGSAHATKLTQAKSLTGQFSGHLERVIFCFCDEALLADKKADHSRLKGIVTEDELMFERKQMTPVVMRNRMRTLMASNNDWVLDVDADDRRFFILEVSGEHAKQGDWFDPIWKQMFEGGDIEKPAAGTQAFFADMLQMDLTGFVPWDVPKTEASAMQKQYSMPPVHQWWYSVLLDRKLPDVIAKGDTVEHKNFMPITSEHWRQGDFDHDWSNPNANAVPYSVLRTAFEDWCERNKLKPVSTTQMGKDLKAILPRVKETPQRWYRLGAWSQCVQLFLKHFSVDQMDGLEISGDWDRDAQKAQDDEMFGKSPALQQAKQEGWLQ